MDKARMSERVKSDPDPLTASDGTEKPRIRGFRERQSLPSQGPSLSSIQNRGRAALELWWTSLLLSLAFPLHLKAPTATECR